MQALGEHFGVADMPIFDNVFCQWHPPPALQEPTRSAANYGNSQYLALLNMKPNLRDLKAIVDDLLITRRTDGYINASGLPLYYGAFVYKLPK